MFHYRTFLQLNGPPHALQSLGVIRLGYLDLEGDFFILFYLNFLFPFYFSLLLKSSPDI